MEMLTRFLNRGVSLSAELKRGAARRGEARGEGGRASWYAIKQTLLLDVTRTCSEKMESVQITECTNAGVFLVFSSFFFSLFF